MGFLLSPLVMSAQSPDTTAKYPWRLSYFPYLTVSPNDGLMGLGRVVFFRQSRWDDRVSLTDEVAIEGGYSTKDAWLARVKGDFPRIAPGWRLQVIGEAAKTRQYTSKSDQFDAAGRTQASVEITRSLGGPIAIALRGDAVHVHELASAQGESSLFRQNDARARLALIADFRDREYDTRTGGLLQAGLLVGSSRRSYSGWYAMASGWLSLSAATRITGRAGLRFLSRSVTDANRIMPAWEDEFVMGGGPESNRALPLAAGTDYKMELASVEIRHDVFTFPAGAVALVGFLDAGRAYCDCIFLIDVPGIDYTIHDWIIGPGGGVAIRLLRNAVLTGTVGFAKGHARVYVSSGWAW